MKNKTGLLWFVTGMMLISLYVITPNFNLSVSLSRLVATVILGIAFAVSVIPVLFPKTVVSHYKIFNWKYVLIWSILGTSILVLVLLIVTYAPPVTNLVSNHLVVALIVSIACVALTYMIMWLAVPEPDRTTLNFLQVFGVLLALTFGILMFA